MNYDRKINIYEGDTTIRYILGSVNNRNDVICWIGFNPSYADNFKADPTIRKIINISKFNGYDDWIMINLCSQRTSKPNLLEKDKEKTRCNHENNLCIIDKYLKTFNQITIVFAYGNLIDEREYLKDYLSDIKKLLIKYKIKVKIISLTKEEHPLHPSARGKYYVSPDTVLKDFSLLDIK